MYNDNKITVWSPGKDAKITQLFSCSKDKGKESSIYLAVIIKTLSILSSSR